MDISLEELIRDCAISIVYSDEHYHKASFNSVREKLYYIVNTLLHNEVVMLKEEKNEKRTCIDHLEINVEETTERLVDRKL